MLNFYMEIFYDLLMVFAEKIHSCGKDLAHQCSWDGRYLEVPFFPWVPKGIVEIPRNFLIIAVVEFSFRKPICRIFSGSHLTFFSVSVQPKV